MPRNFGGLIDRAREAGLKVVVLAARAMKGSLKK